MSIMLPKGAMQYKQVGTQSGIENANPHRLIQMLMEGALEKIATAKGFMLRNDYENKGKNISWAISIIGGLEASLDKSAGGELSQNLEGLYQYMSRRLLEANINNDETMLDEVMGLLREIKDGWDGIEQEAKELYSKKNTANQPAQSAV
jgi:flagellar secretion chaperone FliS